MAFRRIYADLSPLLDEAPILTLASDASSGGTTATVLSVLGAAANDIALFRDLGSELAEVKVVSTATGNTLTLTAALDETHPAGTAVKLLKYDQVRFYRAAAEVDANSDDSTLTALAAAQALDPTTTLNRYDDSVYTSGYYYYKFINSATADASRYSDPIPWAAARPRFAEGTVGSLLEQARRELNFEYQGTFTKEIAIDKLNEGLITLEGEMKHWARYLVADYALGQTARGVFDHALPSDIYDNETGRSILSVRLGNALAPLLWRDEKEFDQLLAEVSHTTVRTQPAVGATSLAIVNSYDFDDDGSVDVYTSNTKDSITYTGVTRSATAGSLTGVPASGSGSIEATHAVGQNVWQGHQEGEPRYWNVRQGRLRYWPLPSSDWVNRNVHLDYYTEATRVDSESDTIDALRWDVLKRYLRWEAKNQLRNNGKPDMADGDYLLFREGLRKLVRNEISGQKFKLAPKLNRIDYVGTDRRFNYT